MNTQDTKQPLYKLGQKIVVNTGGSDTIAHIDLPKKDVHGFYWKEQGCYLVRFTDDPSKLLCNGAITREQYINEPDKYKGNTQFTFFMDNSQYIPANCIREFKETQPLYKVLNEQRTQGEWKASPYETIQSVKDPVFWHHRVFNQQNTMTISKGISTDPEKAKANAQYTALAVNNLHILAERLNKMCEWHEKQATWDKGDNGYYAAREALNNIS